MVGSQPFMQNGQISYGMLCGKPGGFVALLQATGIVKADSKSLNLISDFTILLLFWFLPVFADRWKNTG